MGFLIGAIILAVVYGIYKISKYNSDYTNDFDSDDFELPYIPTVKLEIKENKVAPAKVKIVKEKKVAKRIKKIK